MLGVLMAAVALLAANPFEGRKLYVDPYSPAAQQAAAWRETRPDDAAEMDEIATAPPGAVVRRLEPRRRTGRQ